MTVRDTYCHASREFTPPRWNTNNPKQWKKEAGRVGMGCRRKELAHEKEDWGPLHKKSLCADHVTHDVMIDCDNAFHMR